MAQHRRGISPLHVAIGVSRNRRCGDGGSQRYLGGELCARGRRHVLQPASIIMQPPSLNRVEMARHVVGIEIKEETRAYPVRFHRLKSHGVVRSMSRRGNYWDKARWRAGRTLRKLRSREGGLVQLHRGVLSNQRRRHSAFGCQRVWASGSCAEPASTSTSRQSSLARATAAFHLGGWATALRTAQQGPALRT